MALTAKEEQEKEVINSLVIIRVKYIFKSHEQELAAAPQLLN
jgi:hypothetical protein